MKEKNEIEILQSNLEPEMVKDPLFMLLCPQKKKRNKFISTYFSYYLNHWQKNGNLFYSSSKKTAAVLISPDEFKYNFSGKNGFALKINENSANILNRMQIIENIIEIIMPQGIEKRMLNIYGNPGENLNDILILTENAMEKAKQEGFVLIYETLSKKLVPIFEEKGFEVCYAKQFLNTQFFQTIMTYNFE